MYKFEQTPKATIITLSGFFTPEEAQKFMADYKNELKKIVPSSKALVLDGSKLSTASQDIVPALSSCMKMYVSDGFRKIFSVKFDSSITNMQVSKLWKDLGYESKIVSCDSVADALRQI
ncbi:MAG: hypothetical protein GXY01_10045 [Clostridiales bacterium]|jgi:hypothetical protein|nr:hypothetical protein [Clostridiales bacterium]